MSETNGDLSRNTVTADGVEAPLARWLERRLGRGEPVAITSLGRPKGGFSAETWLVDATVGDIPERFVLRRETPDPPIYPTQVPGLEVEVDIQYRVMEALTRAGGIPVAPLVGYETDPSVLGQPFFVMGFIGGEIPAESPPYPTDGFFTQLSAPARHQVIESGLGALAKVHQVDWRGVGLEWLVAPGTEPGVETQLAVWQRYGEAELAGRAHPVLDDGLRWLRDHPASPSPVVFNWGDPRPGNIIFDQGRCACLTDFEACSIAPPEVDLGWWLMFDWTMHEGAGLAARPDGDPSRDEQIELYAKASGHEPGSIRWFEVFAAVRYCYIVVRVMNRAVAQGHLPADQTIWRDNPASACLAALLGG